MFSRKLETGGPARYQIMLDDRNGRYLGEAEPWHDPPRRTMAHVNFGPEILYRTGHQVFSIPNHRLQTGYTDTYRAMSATTDEAARVILQRCIVDRGPRPISGTLMGLFLKV